MVIFMPKEIKCGEGRFPMCPNHVYDAVYAGAAVYMEKGAGEKSGFFDEFYRARGTRIISRPKDKEEFWRLMRPDKHGFGQLAVLKVKELLPEEYYFIQPCLPIISFGHLASNRELTELVIERNGTYLSLEDIVESDGSRRVLAGMSKIAGEEGIRIGMKYFSGPKPELIIVGYGTVGQAAHWLSEKSFWLSVTAIDPDMRKIKNYAEICRKDEDSPAPFGFLTCPPEEIPQLLKRLMETEEYHKPLLINLAPYAPENKAPIIITNEMRNSIPDNSVIVDTSIDQGGACEFSRVTTHENPAIELERGIKYIGIPNFPGGVSERSTPVFSESVFPYMMQIIKLGFIGALKENPALRGAVSIYNGRITSAGLAKTFGLEYTSIETLL
ncbi:MAG: hypothetical protein A3G49_00580 [Candidatus Sungbacteria bacterium RIFCSPLOWO2_12_FULL_41_11]|uniref:Uncharacterized protein n=1 Tax=Candidatus Sungbacteria bacterium RIFCSPLOWO2_12_FULL_41_11 TaxID=1802286 RepID=A0A1G2LMY8_9BACT|nr:MAG: Alanine dehydrogenase [Parcubacteria group bacterium GW2011_GWA2_42_14]OGZ99458.1 MAG: hypothetical protein A3D41_00835 [Candidatus Sungbacteria bacterium RIFCSPHIGHO2_02_FULL_41_12b]OHA12978.1 MAG: hypothetical protein A3G49_00580 [Candidatus Sungbacteria bacterium RIFCSPLOWO2_12_FULL_41_11]